MYYKFIILLSLSFVLVFYSFAQPSVVWNKSFTTNPDFDYKIISVKQDNAGDIIIGGFQKKINSFHYDPILIKYDQQGNLVLNWTISDSSYSESVFEVAVDNLNDIYVLNNLASYNFGIADTVKFMKIDGLTGQIIFEYDFLSENYGGVMKFYNNYIYLACGDPSYYLYKYDMQGNQLWSHPITGFKQVFDVHFYLNQIFVIGDSLNSLNTNTFIAKSYDNNGLFQWKGDFNSPSYFNLFRDSEIDNYGNIWLTSIYFNNSTNSTYSNLHALNNGALLYDTLVGSVNQSISLSRIMKNSDNIFWLTNNHSSLGNISKIIKYNSNFFSSEFSTTDSVITINNYNAGTDLISDVGNNVLILNTTIGNGITDSDYRIMRFDSSGNLNLYFKYSNFSLSKDESSKIFYSSNSIYIIGKYYEASFRPINILKIDLPLSLNDHLNSNNFEVYPNPVTSSEINFSRPLKASKIALYDLYGRIIYQSNSFSGSKLYLPQDINMGIYILNMEENRRTHRSKLLIMKEK